MQRIAISAASTRLHLTGGPLDPASGWAATRAGTPQTRAAAGARGEAVWPPGYAPGVEAPLAWRAAGLAGGGRRSFAGLLGFLALRLGSPLALLFRRLRLRGSVHQLDEGERRRVTGSGAGGDDPGVPTSPVAVPGGHGVE